MKTSESVTPKHPDKLCDRISDAILDACLAQDENSRVAVETMGGHGIVTITGEVTTDAFFDAREIVERIAPKNGVQVNIVKQSHEISRGVDTGGAGDQGIMIGYACDENESHIPQELYLARSLCRFIWDSKSFDGKQDGKTQVTLNDDGTISSLVASFCNVSHSELKKECFNWLEKNELEKEAPIMHLNPAGDWSVGGFTADTGVTGRKLAVDNYGTRVPIGGGAFSGKDASKVDRSGAYRARQLALQILKQENAKEVLVRIAYAIGIDFPMEVTAEITRKDGKKEERRIFGDEFEECKPKNIIRLLNLKKPQFEETAMWGHFGHGFSWEKL